MLPDIDPQRPLPLLPLEAFGEIVALLANRTIWYVPGVGNPGDSLIHAGARCLFKKTNTEVKAQPDKVDFLVWGGGGNLGTFWPASHARRQVAFNTAREAGLPIIIMPQSATDANEALGPDFTIFARERSTKELYPHSKLAPDMALAFDEDVAAYAGQKQMFDFGVFLRRDKESSGEFDPVLSIFDVAQVSIDFRGYFQVASLFEAIVTDRLHFCIASLILGRKTLLLPNSYYKNHGVYEAWLKQLGCLWQTKETLKPPRHYRPEEIRTQLRAAGVLQRPA